MMKQVVIHNIVTGLARCRLDSATNPITLVASRPGIVVVVVVVVVVVGRLVGVFVLVRRAI